jgi:hypothetical protein
MITSQLIVKKCRLTALEIAQKSSEGQFLKASRIWESYSALEDFWGKTIENFNKKTPSNISNVQPRKRGFLSLDDDNQSYIITQNSNYVY